MTVELRPLGVACNLACTYCYQEPMREANNKNAKYDVDLMLKAAEATGQEFNLFGGEALLVPKKDLERFWRRGYELYKRNGVQTNGTLITDDHILLFQKYNVHVGVSIDGPYELNGLREVRGKAGNGDATLDSTTVIMNNIVKMRANGVNVSIIITLHRLNGMPDKLPRLIEFMKWLQSIGVNYGNIHALEVDKTMPDQEIHVLTQEENAQAFLTLANFLKENRELGYSPFTDMLEGMKGDDTSAICTWKNCDSMNTQAVYGIEASGGLSNCGRTTKEGIDWYKADDFGYERYLSLYNTPQDLGGCNGCRFFVFCGGSCPGEAMDNDFRNKTIHCHTQKVMLAHYEEEVEEMGLLPFTKRPDLKEIEKRMIKSMANNRQTSIKSITDQLAAEQMTVKITRTVNIGRPQ